MTDDDIPAYLLRHPWNAEREALVADAWEARWALLREQNFALARGDDEVVSLMLLHCKDNAIPRLGPGDHKVKVLAVSEKWARIDLGPQVGPVMLKRETWDAIEKEKIMDVMQTTAEAPTPPTPPPAAKKARAPKAAPVAEAPAPKKAAAKKAAPAKAAAAKTGEGRDEFGCLLTSHRAHLFQLLVKNEGKAVTYAAACKKVYGEPDVPMIGGVIKGCQINAENVGCSVTVDGKGKTQTITFRRGKAKK